MHHAPAGSPAQPAPPPSRRSLLHGGALLGVAAVTSAAAVPSRGTPRAAPARPPGARGRRGGLVLDYRPRQPTGWSPGFNFSMGGHTPSADFTFHGSKYRISLLPIGQPGDTPNPVYEDTPADPTVTFRHTLTAAYGRYYSFHYAGGQGQFSIQSCNVFARVTTKPQPTLNYGADLYVVYQPAHHGKPVSPSELQWIQVIYWRNGPHGPGGSSTVDSGRANPFYIWGGFTSINGTQVVNYYDQPQLIIQQDTTLSDLFIAELFLARDTGTKDSAGKDIVTIYDGLKYGWRVHPLNLPAPPHP
jgi:hypothetical protein